MKKIIAILLTNLLAIGCASKKQKQSSVLGRYIEEPISQIQINPIPSPFNFMHPYAIWVNGERLQIPSSDIELIVKEFNLSVDPPENTAAIHSGAGWLEPINFIK